MATHCGWQWVEFQNPCGYLPASNGAPLEALSQPIATEVSMVWRQKLSLTVLAILVGLLAGCGHSEEEWQAKLKENQDLQSQLNAEKAAHQKSDADLAAAGTQIDQLKGQLKKAGVDLSNVNADLADQKAALDKMRKDK